MLWLKISLYSFLLFSSNFVFAQNHAALSHKKDTSFTNNSALKSIKSQFPDATLAMASNSKNIKCELDIIYCKSENLTLDVFSPKSINNKQAIIFIHGGGWRTGDKSQHHQLAKELASRGYVFITPAYRLSTVALYPAAVIDIKAAIKWTKLNAKKLKIDKEKITIAGFSAGGQLAAFVGNTADIEKFEASNCIIKESSTVHKIIDIDGILAFIHPESGEGDDSKSMSAATRYFGYNKTENPDLWNEASTLKYLNEKSPPTLFINSSVGRMHAGRTDYINALNQHKIYTKVHTFEDAPHAFPLMNLWFKNTIELIDDFLQKP